jgi:hypothetical protein
MKTMQLLCVREYLRTSPLFFYTQGADIEDAHQEKIDQSGQLHYKEVQDFPSLHNSPIKQDTVV